MFEAWQQFWGALLEEPKKLTDLQMQYWNEVRQYWESMPNSYDKRFKNEAWDQSEYFHAIKEFYLLNVNYTKKMLEETPGLDIKTVRKVRFMIDQWMNAFSPHNFVLTNPEVILKTFRTQGENIKKGVENLMEDFNQANSTFNIKMTDMQAFEIGKNIAITRGKVVYRNDLIELIQYSPSTETVYEIPMLIAPPWINKYYILDLSPENSFVKSLVEQGVTVFLISWINPDKSYANKGLDEYLKEGVLEAVAEVQKRTKSKVINALGYCAGGTILACALAYFASQKKSPIQSATFLTTLLDFSDVGDLEVFIDENQISQIERMMDQVGYLDGRYMAATFNLLRSNDLIWFYFINNYLKGLQPRAFDILYWNTDSTNIPTKCHSQYLRELYLHNRLVQKEGIMLNGVPIDLSKITVPTYCVAAETDHIAPWKTVFKSMQYLNGDSRFILSQSGHVSGVINPPGKTKYGYRISDLKLENPEKWYDSSKLHKESWWCNWYQWLIPQSGKKVQSKTIENAIEDAPGSYVKVRFA